MPDCVCGHREHPHKRLDGTYRIDCYTFLPDVGEWGEWCPCPGYEAKEEPDDPSTYRGAAGDPDPAPAVVGSEIRKEITA